MKQSNTAKYAYLAGIIDGEGTICIVKKSDKRYGIIIAVGQKNGKLIDWLYGNFSGTVWKRFMSHKSVNNKNEIYEHKNSLYLWQLGATEKIYEILKRILPFSKEKKRQIEIAIEFCIKDLKRRKLANKKGFITFYNAKDMEVWGKVAEMYKKRLEDERRIFIPCAAVETKFVESSLEDKR